MADSLLPSLGINWALSTISGYGIYGLQIALEFLRQHQGQGGAQLILTRTPFVPGLPDKIMATLQPAFELGVKLDKFRKTNPTELLMFKHPVLHGSGNDFAGFDGQDKIWGTPNVGCVALEQLVFSDNGRNIAKNYDQFIAISRWNEGFLKSLDIGRVDLCHQGIDAALFHPGPRSKLYPGRFVIFSGGKFEFRKGQDIIVAAFKRFHQRHPDALLLTCWQNLTAPDKAAFERAGLCNGVPEMAPNYGLELQDWMLRQGLPAESFVALPFIDNPRMPALLRGCDAAIFTNRCEGGTNLVAMEAMACGVPTYVSYNTGQKDLVDLIGAGALRGQKPVPLAGDLMSTEDWGESDIDEVVEALETVYSRPGDAQAQAKIVAENMQQWQWGSLNAKLLKCVGAGPAGSNA